MIFRFLRSGYEKLKTALKRARDAFGSKIRSLFQQPMDEKVLEQLEELLFSADFGVKTARELKHALLEWHTQHPTAEAAEYVVYLKEYLIGLLQQVPPLSEIIHPLEVILIVGVNGNGKTTSLAKLAHFFQKQGKKPLFGAADTFRAAAIEQLETWAERVQVDIVKGAPGGDPAAVAFDAISAAKARGADVVFIDTAGRLHTKKELMQELEKIKRICHKAQPGAPHEIWLVLDATTGQNAVDQAKTFHQFVPLTGVILTKLDGTAKGGIVVAIQRELQVPVRFVGIGEGLEDLQPFDAVSFVEGLLGSDG